MKVRDLPKIASNLMASAGHLLEMEFEDLNIIAEAQKGDVYKSALSSGNKIKNRYLNILPCKLIFRACLIRKVTYFNIVR